MGEVVADANLASTKAQEKGGAEVAFINSGSIRTGLTRLAVSYDNLYTAQPFGNQLTVHTMTGEEMIRRLLEQQFRADGGGGYPAGFGELHLQIPAARTGGPARGGWIDCASGPCYWRDG